MSKIFSLDMIKVLISSGVIAVAGIVVTYCYNNQQLAISRNKEIANLIPKLASTNPDERQFTATLLALYGKHAIPPLIAALNTGNNEARIAVVESLRIIGKDAIPQLEKAYTNEFNPINIRSSSLYALGQMGAEDSYRLSREALENENMSPIVRKDAAMVMGFLKKKEAVGLLLSQLTKCRENDKYLNVSILWSLGEIEGVRVTEDILTCVKHKDEEIREQTMWTLGRIGDKGDKTIQDVLGNVISNDESERVRAAAQWASGEISKK